jgi:hypothetical protein
MIHHTPEGRFIKLGLNFSRSANGFRLLWAWYDFAKHEAFTARVRFRWRIRPYFLWSVERHNVIESYMNMHGLAMVEREVLEDLNAIELDYKHLNDSVVLIKP